MALYQEPRRFQQVMIRRAAIRLPRLSLMQRATGELLVKDPTAATTTINDDQT
ncbi:hypothetical protein OK016_19365 [Vibrio chagasii]|nr:hypothetical protein [Vibrio chagasii]